MIQIGIVSDTHSHIDQKLFDFFQDCHEIWHAGDIGNMSLLEQLEAFKPTKGVFGNIDDHKVRSAWPLDTCFKCEDVSVCMLHIAGYPGKFNKKAIESIQLHKPSLFIAGHSHILKVQYDKQNNMLFINPGAYGKVGFHKIRTAIRIKIDGARIYDLEILETAR